LATIPVRGGLVTREIRIFLGSLFGAKPDELYVLVWTLTDKNSRWFRNLDEAIAFVGGLNGWDAYVGVGLSPSDFGPNHRCPSDEAAGIVSVWADFDFKSDAHQKSLPATIEDARSLIPSSFPPSIIVATGNGIHVWWLFKEPWVFENDDERKKAAALIRRFHTLLAYNSSEHGWTFDRLSDLARVLRIPGTTNGKDPSNPKRVEIYSSCDRRYNPSDFKEYLDALSIPDADADEHGSGNEWADRFTDKPLVISPEAAIADNVLARWMEEDLRFRDTWNHLRKDLSDYSQSGYDMALACFGVASCLSEQQIVDLIVHNRRLHGAKRPKGLDYYRRTISKAAQNTVASGLASETPVAAGPPPIPQFEVTHSTPVGAGNPPAYDPNAKAKLCDQISRVFGVRILRLVKVTGKEPVYFMDVEEGRIEFQNVGSLISQKSVTLALAAKVGRLIPKFKTKQWEQLSQLLLDACLIEEGTDELGFEGAARTYISQSLLENSFISSLEGETVHNQRKPMIRDGKIMISATDLQMYINKTTMQTLSVKAVASMVAGIGGKAVRVRGSSFKEQSRWALAAEEFDPKDYGNPQEVCANVDE